MGLFTPYHGNYEVTYKAKVGGVISWEKEKEQTMIIEADDLSDAKMQAKKQLKAAGYTFCHIVSASLIKRTPGSRASNEKTRKEKSSDKYSQLYSASCPDSTSSSYSSNLSSLTTNKKASVKLGIVILVAILVVIGIVAGSVINLMKVDGTYYLISITGTANVSANKNENYLTLKDGTCTLYLNLINPEGQSTLTYKYTGNLTSNIEFEKSFIHMDYKDRVVIRLNHDNGTYNIFTYARK